MQDNKILIYLAGPIDDVSTVDAMKWRQEVKAETPEVAFYSPAHAFMASATKENFPVVERANNFVIQYCCHGMLANLAGPGRGFGTIREIEKACVNNRPVAVLHDPENPIVSWMAHDVALFDHPLTALSWLVKEINDRINAQSGMMFMMPGMQ